MSSSSALALLLGAAAVAFVLRSSLIVVLSGVGIPDRTRRILEFIGPAALASLAISFAFGGTDGPHASVAEVVTLVVALVVTAWRRNYLITLAVAMPVLWLLSSL